MGTSSILALAIWYIIAEIMRHRIIDFSPHVRSELSQGKCILLEHPRIVIFAVEPIEQWFHILCLCFVLYFPQNIVEIVTKHNIRYVIKLFQKL